MPTRLISFLFTAVVFGSVSFAQTLLPQTTPGQTTVAAIPDPAITAAQRLRWLAHVNLSPMTLLEDIALGAEDTRVNSPKEYGPHWVGFGKRVGITAANYGVKTAMEAGLGAIWGEDPRYERTQGEAVPNRLGNVVKMTFMARNRAGNVVPAYARLIAIPGGSFLANTWMPDSQAKVGDAVVRAGLSFLSRMSENAWKEFRPRH